MSYHRLFVAAYALGGAVTGTGVAACNLFNSVPRIREELHQQIHSGPLVIATTTGFQACLCGSVSLVKGAIYGLAFPLSAATVARRYWLAVKLDDPNWLRVATHPMALDDPVLRRYGCFHTGQKKPF